MDTPSFSRALTSAGKPAAGCALVPGEPAVVPSTVRGDAAAFLAEDRGPFGFLVTATLLLREVIGEERRAAGLAPLTSTQVDAVLRAAWPCWDQITEGFIGTNRVSGDKGQLLQARAALVCQRLREESNKL